MESGESLWIPYGGAALGSRDQVWWQVSVWVGDEVSPWSPAAFFEVGLLAPSDWSAEWIGGRLVGGPRSYVPVPFFTGEVELGKDIVDARLYASALGVYEARINGHRVGDQELAPGWTDFGHRVRYQVFDVTGLLKQGTNAVEAAVGDGWYCGNLGWDGRQIFGRQPLFIGQLEVVYGDGSRQTFGTDSSWKHAYGPIVEADLLMGQSVDMRNELSDWEPAVVHSPGACLVATDSPPIRVTEEIVPIEVKEIPSWPAAKWMFDMGQNMVGRIRLRVTGEPGQTLIIRYGEMLDKNGKLYTENLRSARQTDYYTLGSSVEEVWEPQFTFHGFRYVEISGLVGPATSATVTGIVLHSDVDKTGDFECSDPLISQLQKNIDWGQRGNFVDVPTDCPQRDERLGWTGDAQVFVRTAAFNRDVDLFFRKYAQDLEDSQFESGAIPPFAPRIKVLSHEGGPAWADAFLICPWEIYQAYGDLEILRRHFPAMQRYFSFLEETSLENRRCWQDYTGFHGFGDWLSHEANTPLELIGTAFFAHAAGLLSKIASVLGESGLASAYTQRFLEIRQTFRDRFITPQGFVASGTQTAYVLALHFDLMPDELRATAMQELVDDIGRRNWRLSTGFIGTPYLCDVLTKGGRLDVAYKLLNQKAWPSWLYPVTKGATTIWERWDGWTEEKGFQDPGMNSFNHYAYGAIGDWLYTTVLGISAFEPSYKRITLACQPGGGLDWAKGYLDCPYGRIESSWRISEGRFEWDVTVPPNTLAFVTVPFSEETRWVGSGRWQFSSSV